MEITKIRSLGREKQGFLLTRHDTGDEYIFLHFLTPARIWANGRWLDAHPDSCILYPKHSTQILSSPDCELVHDWFHISGSIEELLALYALPVNTLLQPASGHFVTELTQSMEYEILGQRPFYSRICACRLEELFARLSRSCAERGTPLQDANIARRFREFRVRLSGEFQQPWSVESMAAQLNLSVSRFHYIYKTLFGVSPKSDLNAMRIERAKELLRYTASPVSEIALLVGYASPFQFIRQFRAGTGTTPHIYRVAGAVEKPSENSKN